MNSSNSVPADSIPGPKVRVLTLIVLFLTVMIGVGFGIRYYLLGNLNPIAAILIAFLAINILICYWEACLFFHRQYIEERAEYWCQLREKDGFPHLEFFTSKIKWSKALSSRVWAEVWATYTQFDQSFADRRTYGFNADVGNGFVTFVPAVLLFIAFVSQILPVYVTGILGIMMFWQWVYMTCIYFSSYYVAKRHRKVSRRELYLFVWGTNFLWIAFPLLGLYASIRIVIDGNFSVLM